MADLKNKLDWLGHWWPAPAKLNLMLNITGQRADGYHEMQTVFQLLNGSLESISCYEKHCRWVLA